MSSGVVTQVPACAAHRPGEGPVRGPDPGQGSRARPAPGGTGNHVRSRAPVREGSSADLLSTSPISTGITAPGHIIEYTFGMGLRYNCRLELRSSGANRAATPPTPTRTRRKTSEGPGWPFRRRDMPPEKPVPSSIGVVTTTESCHSPGTARTGAGIPGVPSASLQPNRITRLQNRLMAQKVVSPATYWRRRVVVFGGGIAVLTLLVWGVSAAVSGILGGSPAAGQGLPGPRS